MSRIFIAGPPQGPTAAEERHWTPVAGQLVLAASINGQGATLTAISEPEGAGHESRGAMHAPKGTISTSAASGMKNGPAVVLTSMPPATDAWET